MFLFHYLSDDGGGNWRIVDENKALARASDAMVMGEGSGTLTTTHACTSNHSADTNTVSAVGANSVVPAWQGVYLFNPFVLTARGFVFLPIYVTEE